MGAMGSVEIPETDIRKTQKKKKKKKKKKTNSKPNFKKQEVFLQGKK
jgi:hypothetical protein